jgi:hypothetical protein
MRGAALGRLAPAVAAALAAGCGGGSAPDRPGPGPRTAAPLAVVSALDGSRPAIVRRVDPRTLAPSGRRVVLGEYHDAWSFSPDRGRVAFGISASAADGRGRVGIRVVDVRRMRTVRDVATGIAAEAVGWLSSRRLVALLQSGRVVVVDPADGRTIADRQFAAAPRCAPQPAAVGAGAVAFLLAARGAHPTRLVAVDGAGRMRAAALPRIRSATACAGLALDGAGRRAFVAGPRGPVAAVDLVTLRVTYVPVAIGAADRLRLAWLGRGLLAVGRSDRRRRGLGVQVVDVASGGARTIAPGAVRVAAGRLLVFDGGAPSAPGGRGSGLRVYDATGALRLRRFAGERIWDVQVAGATAYVRGRALRVLDVRTGRVHRRAPESDDEVTLLAPPG